MKSLRIRIYTITVLLGLGATVPPLQSQDQQSETRSAAEAFGVADTQLNAAYNKLLNQLSSANRKLLQTSQQAWLRYRDAEADQVADQMRGGTGAQFLQQGSLGRLTRERLAQLQARSTAGDNAPAVTSGFAGADQQLNAAYNNLMNRLDKEGRQLLQTSQQAWIRFRDAEAKSVAGQAGNGAGQYDTARERLTRDRIRHLQAG